MGWPRRPTANDITDGPGPSAKKLDRTLNAERRGASVSIHAASLADLLAPLAARLLNAFVEPASAARVSALAETVPASSIRYFGFERHLGRHDARVDFAFSLTERGLDWIHDTKRWPAVCALSRSWRTDIPSLPGNLWLEFDTSAHTRVEPPPNVFVALDRKGESDFVEPAVLERMVREASSPTNGGPSSSATAFVTQCFNACPATVSRVYLAFMLGRQQGTFRVCVLPLSSEGALTFLQTIAWAGDLSAVAAVIRPYGMLCDMLCVHVSPADSGDCTVGFELSHGDLPTERQPKQQAQWTALLDQLVSDGLCDPSEKTALLAWPSYTEFEAPLIERLIDAACPSPERLLDGTFYTCLDHIKLTIGADRRTSAKAYFGAFLAPRPLAEAHRR